MDLVAHRSARLPWVMAVCASLLLGLLVSLSVDLAGSSSAYAAPHKRPLLKVGMAGKHVKRVQRKLRVRPASGYFGKVTLRAVKSFQSRRGIPTTGMVGPLTWNALLAPVDSGLGGQPSVQQGSTGEAVRLLQTRLGMSQVTGYFGPITFAYVRALQKAAGRPVTGVVDGATWRKVGVVRFRAPQTTAPGSSVTAPSNGSDMARRAAAYAVAQVGKPYCFDAVTGPSCFGCNGLTWRAWYQAGYNWPILMASGQHSAGYTKPVARGQERVGDLLFWINNNGTDKPGAIDHVGIVIDPRAGTFVHASNPRSGVTMRNYKTDPYYAANPPVAIGRIVNQR